MQCHGFLTCTEIPDDIWKSAVKIDQDEKRYVAI